MQVDIKYTQKDLVFEAQNAKGVSVFIGQTDNPAKNHVIRPMETLLMALASCSSIDIIKILKKQRQNVKNYRVEIEAKRQEKTIPSLFETITLKFIFEGNISEQKIKRSINLSLEKYCSVSKIIEKTAIINYKLVLNGKTL